MKLTEFVRRRAYPEKRLGEYSEFWRNNLWLPVYALLIGNERLSEHTELFGGKDAS